MKEIENILELKLKDVKELRIFPIEKPDVSINFKCSAEGLNLFCNGKSVAMADKPRVGFETTGLKGRGIMRKTDNPDVVRLEPYKISFIDGGNEIQYEKDRSGWIKTVPQPTVNLYSLHFWLKAMRFVTAPMSAIPVITGTLMAAVDGKLNLFIFLAALTGGVAAHMGTNLLSDYNDYENGFDTPGALSSHTGVLVKELVNPDVILKSAFILFCITFISGIYLIFAAGWQVVIFGVIGVLGGMSYTAKPIAIKYKGFGEFLTSFLMGPLMVTGAYFVQCGTLTLPVIIISLCLGFFVGSVTLANNIRDMMDDYANGFTTLPYKMGYGRARMSYYVMLLVPYILIIFLFTLQPGYWWPVLSVFVSFPYALQCINAMKNGGKDSSEIRISALNNPYPLFSINLYNRYSSFLLIGLIVNLVIKILKT
ncbi:MAG: prenyltransferase [Candidatus Goldbacteria bacterium]|nr:prenyltransferase [Candidatus Goldiibacteriota bacterium]